MNISQEIEQPVPDLANLGIGFSDNLDELIGWPGYVQGHAITYLKIRDWTWWVKDSQGAKNKRARHISARVSQMSQVSTLSIEI